MKTPETNPQNHLISDKHAIIIWGEGSFLQLRKNDAESTVYLHREKMNLDTYIIPYTKINSKWIRDLNMEGKTIKLQVGNITECLCVPLYIPNRSLKPMLELTSISGRWVNVDLAVLHMPPPPSLLLPVSPTPRGAVGEMP